MAKSLAQGDYRLVMAFESASTEGNWYRVLQEKETAALSCDCPRWLHKRRGAARSCKHTEMVAHLLASPTLPSEPTPTDIAHTQSLVGAAREQWQGLEGTWGMQERDTLVGTTRYRVVLLRLDTPTHLTGTGVVAFAHRHGVSTARLIPGVAGWAGYALAAQIAQQAGFAMVGQPPEHFKWQRSGRSATTHRIGLRDILRVADNTDLGDGLTPAQRAENTLQLFLGDLYTTLQAQGFLDVPSRLHADWQRVYRLRRDPHRQRARRIRLFEQGRYINDLCVVPRESVPEADHLLTVFLQLMTDESTVLRVVQQYNVFPPHSDGNERETLVPEWRAA